MYRKRESLYTYSPRGYRIVNKDTAEVFYRQADELINEAGIGVSTYIYLGGEYDDVYGEHGSWRFDETPVEAIVVHKPATRLLHQFGIATEMERDVFVMIAKKDLDEKGFVSGISPKEKVKIDETIYELREVKPISVYNKVVYYNCTADEYHSRTEPA